MQAGQPVSTHPAVKPIPIKRIKNNHCIHMEDAIIDEDILKLIINDATTFEMVFSMTHTKELAAGFLFTQGIVCARKEILDFQWTRENKECRLYLNETASGRLKNFKKGHMIKGSSGGSLLSSSLSHPSEAQADSAQITPDQILSLMNQHWNKSLLFHQTGAVHSAGLCDHETVIDYYEDIGRHNAVDKLAGTVLLNAVNTGSKVATLSCRMSLEIIGKLIRTQIPIVISNAAPTLSAVKLAEQSGLTMIGFAREGRFNIYTHPDRVILDQD